MTPAHQQIEQAIRKRKKGELIFPADFRGMGSEAAIKMTLGRLHKQGIIKRLANGIYVLPKVDPFFGEILPAPEDIAEALAKRDRVHIKPAGAYALHKLGLTTQIPAKLVYVTDGTSRQINLGRTSITFKATTPKKLAMEGSFSSLIVQALEELGTTNIDPKTETRIKELLAKEEPEKLIHDLKLAPGKISDYLLRLQKRPL